jgi:hypothetical protein
MKKLLATLLTLALALSLALPAMAAVNWDEFRITKQPQDLTIKHGDSFTLSVEVNVPDGVHEVTYQWYNKSLNPIENATSSELHFRPDDSYYPTDSRLGGSQAEFQVWITAYIKNADDVVVVVRRILSNTVSVQTERTALGKFLDVTIAPFGYAFSSVIATAPVSVPLFPLAYLYWLVLAYISGFRALFS